MWNNNPVPHTTAIKKNNSHWGLQMPQSLLSQMFSIFAHVSGYFAAIFCSLQSTETEVISFQVQKTLKIEWKPELFRSDLQRLTQPQRAAVIWQKSALSYQPSLSPSHETNDDVVGLACWTEVASLAFSIRWTSSYKYFNKQVSARRIESMLLITS